MKCVTKPIEYECIQWNGNNIDDIKSFCGDKVFVFNKSLNWLRVSYNYSQKWQDCYLNDWILKTSGNYYRVIHKDDFDRIYGILN